VNVHEVKTSYNKFPGMKVSTDFFQGVQREGSHWATYHEPNLWLAMADSWEVMDYLLYSLDLVPSDFCLFAGK
jgi:hypothetical protein